MMEIAVINNEVETSEIKSAYSETRQLYFKNAIAVFGIVPMFALMVEYHKQNMVTEVMYCKTALMDFKTDSRFLKIVQNNRVCLSGNMPIGNDINIIDVALTELGYYEKYNTAKLQDELNQLIQFVNQ